MASSEDLANGGEMERDASNFSSETTTRPPLSPSRWVQKPPVTGNSSNNNNNSRLDNHQKLYQSGVISSTVAAATSPATATFSRAPLPEPEWVPPANRRRGSSNTSSTNNDNKLSSSAGPMLGNNAAKTKRPFDVRPAPAPAMYWSKAVTYGPKPRPLRAHSSVVVNELMYVFGGTDQRGGFGKVYALELGMTNKIFNRWSTSHLASSRYPHVDETKDIWWTPTTLSGAERSCPRGGIQDILFWRWWWTELLQPHHDLGHEQVLRS